MSASVEEAVSEFRDTMQAISNRNGATISLNGTVVASPDVVPASPPDDGLTDEERAERDAAKLADLQEKWRTRTSEIEKGLGHASVEVVKHTNALKEAKKLAQQLAEELEHRYASGEPTELPKPVSRQTEMFDGDDDDESDDEDNRWQAVPVKAFKFSPGVLKCLSDAGIETIGQLESHTNGGATRITDIDGIGPKAEETILEALDGFWTAWRNDCEAALTTYV